MPAAMIQNQKSNPFPKPLPCTPPLTIQAKNTPGAAMYEFLFGKTKNIRNPKAVISTPQNIAVRKFRATLIPAFLCRP
jgi:hypothetical protein